MKLERIHKILFILTVITTFATGYMSSGSVVDALLFCGGLLFILGSHEMGHYYYGRKYGVDITPPYFIPAPPPISPIGTFGAFIKIKSPISTKKALFDIGIAGPIAGVIATIPILIIGIMMSTIIEIPQNGGGGFIVGDPLIITYISNYILGETPEGYTVFLHPMAFAGWVGLFVTALNLIPSGQLDGGHLVYAFFSKKVHKFISRAVIVTLILLGLGTQRPLGLLNDYFGDNLPSFLNSIPVMEGWLGWMLWAGLLTIIGTGHPPTMYEENDLDGKRILLALLALLIFIGCFTPVPIKIG